MIPILNPDRPDEIFLIVGGSLSKRKTDTVLNKKTSALKEFKHKKKRQMLSLIYIIFKILKMEI